MIAGVRSLAILYSRKVSRFWANQRTIITLTSHVAFKTIEEANLPDPQGSLSKVVPSSAISTANSEVKARGLGTSRVVREVDATAEGWDWEESCWAWDSVDHTLLCQASSWLSTEREQRSHMEELVHVRDPEEARRALRRHECAGTSLEEKRSPVTPWRRTW